MSVTSGEQQSVDLPSPPGAFRRALREHPGVTDGIIVLLYLLVTIGLAVASFYTPNEAGDSFEYAVPDFVYFPRVLLLILMVVITSIALVLRRRYPLWGLIAALGVSVVIPDDMAPNGAVTMAVAVLLYSVPVYNSIRNAWIGYGLSVLASIPMAVISIQINDAEPLDGGAIAAMLTLALLMLIPVALGVNVANRRKYTDAIIDRARQLARERDQLARLAVAEERTRIAREMHDIIAHSVSVMVALSEGAARAAQIQPTEAAKAMQQSAETGRAALTEMRRLIGVLRGPSGDPSGAPSPDMAPMPGTEDLPELIKGFRAAGLTVELTLKGHACEPSSTGARGRDLTIYRTVQEALTNALRYAGPGAGVNVLVDQGADGTRVRIMDDGGVPGQNKPMTGLGSGQGLVGLAERVRVFGGTLDYGRTGSGGWHVSVTLPADGLGAVRTENSGAEGGRAGRVEGLNSVRNEGTEDVRTGVRETIRTKRPEGGPMETAMPDHTDASDHMDGEADD